MSRSLTTWFAYGFSLLAVVALATGGFTDSWEWHAAGAVLAAMAVAFLIVGNAMAARFAKHHEIAQGVRLAELLPEDDLRRRLFAVLSLHFSGASPESLPLARAPRALPPVVVKKEKRRRCRRRGRKRDKGIVLLRAC